MIYKISCRGIKTHYTSNFNLISIVQQNLLERYSDKCHSLKDFVVESFKEPLYLSYGGGFLSLGPPTNTICIEVLPNLFCSLDFHETSNLQYKILQFKDNNCEYPEKYDKKFLKCHEFFRSSSIILTLKQLDDIVLRIRHLGHV
jgi:hypothetical protein